MTRETKRQGVEQGVEGEMATRARKVYVAARELYERGTDWATFFRRIVGDNGVMRRVFPDVESLQQFKSSSAYRQIQEMMAELRGKAEQSARDRRSPHRVHEPTQMITVRVPFSVHQSLLTEAEELGTSLNQLCISKLLQLIESELVPSPRRPSRDAGSGGQQQDDDDEWLKSLVI